MIKSSFIIIPGIGELTENDLWSKGILTWEDLRQETSFIDANKTRKRVIQDYLVRANKAIDNHDITFFAEHLPQKEYWRLCKEYLTSTLFLDIETTGLSLYYDRITLVGTFNGHTIRFFIKDNNLEEIVRHLEKYQVIVTFNGKLFDMPFLKKELPQLKIPPVHIDLRYVLRSLGITGSLKKVEERLGIERPMELRGMGGREATILWSEFMRGDKEALEKLLLYNALDTVNLQRILYFCYQQKLNRVESEFHSGNYQLRLSESHRSKVVNHHLPLTDFRIPNISTKQIDNQTFEVYSNSKKLLKINRDRIQGIEVKIERLLKEIRNRGYEPVSVGIDLSGSQEKASGICILCGREAYLDLVKSDEEIISKVVGAEPTVVSIDSPLSLPRGRCCASDSCECRIHGIIRECERVLKKRGINSYPCLIPSMQNLTVRGINLARVLETQGYQVIESYPGAAQDVLRLPRKRVNLKQLEVDLMNMGIKPISNGRMITHDEIDALTSALVGYFYLTGQYEALGDIDEGYLMIPLINSESS